MGKDWTQQQSHVNFRCEVCKHAWEAEPDLIEPAPELEHHPYRYFANCPAIGFPQFAIVARQQVGAAHQGIGFAAG